MLITITYLAGLWQGSEVDREVLCKANVRRERAELEQAGQQGIAKSSY